MGDRLLDYGQVLIGIAVLWGLFRLSRFLLGQLVSWAEARVDDLNADMVLYAAFMLLLVGLILLPLATAAIAAISPLNLPGGMATHLIMVGVSVIIFSMSEDLFRTFRSYQTGPGGRWTVAAHMRKAVLPLIGFWALGGLLLSPIFYSGLTIVLAIFYLYALSCRPSEQESGSD